MKTFCHRTFLVLLLALFATSCAQNASPPPDKEAKIKATLAQLDPHDRKLAEEQKFCPIQTKSRLGSMGKPIKVMLKEQTVFVCCEACEKDAASSPDKTLAKVKELRDANAGTTGK
jgi:PBP1b-binding outer membrane lipoprotein LpoB